MQFFTVYTEINDNILESSSSNQPGQFVSETTNNRLQTENEIAVPQSEIAEIQSETVASQSETTNNVVERSECSQDQSTTKAFVPEFENHMSPKKYKKWISNYEEIKKFKKNNNGKLPTIRHMMKLCKLAYDTVKRYIGYIAAKERKTVKRHYSY